MQKKFNLLTNYTNVQRSKASLEGNRGRRAMVPQDSCYVNQKTQNNDNCIFYFQRKNHLIRYFHTNSVCIYLFDKNKNKTKQNKKTQNRQNKNRKQKTKQTNKQRTTTTRKHTHTHTPHTPPTHKTNCSCSIALVCNLFELNLD